MNLNSDKETITGKNKTKKISLSIDNMENATDADTDIKYSSNGTHVILDVWGCTFDELNDINLAISFIMQVIEDANMHMLNMSFKKFKPQGLTVVGLLSESHISIHTYPEYKYAAIDLFTCGKGSPLSSLEKNLPLYFTIEQVSSMVIERGIRAKPFGKTRIINDGHVTNLPTRPLPETD